MTENELLQLKKDIEKKISRKAELEGELKFLMKQLKETWNCSSVEEAEEKVKTFESKQEKLTSRLNKKVEELEILLEDDIQED